MKTLTILLLLILTVGIQAKSAAWQKLKPLKSYPGSAYNLKESVAYMEIRGYATRTSKKANTVFAIYRQPLQSYSQNVITTFRSLKQKYSKKANIRLGGNAFFIDTKGKMFQMDMNRDIISLLGTIDTPAEVQLVLWLKREDHGKQCQKSAGGYRVKISEPLTYCTNRNRVLSIDTKGDYAHADYTLSREGCKKRKNTQFVSSKKINYEYYMTIAMDAKGNLYTIGVVGTNKSNDGSHFSVLDKHTPGGQKLWSRRVDSNTMHIAVADRKVYTFDYGKKLLAEYTLEGNKSSSNSAVPDTIVIEEKSINDGEYLPDGVPNTREKITAFISDYVKDKYGNIYVVGNEVLYPSGSPNEIPHGQCGNLEEVNGALIAKLNSRGETVWAKVIDRND